MTTVTRTCAKCGAKIFAEAPQEFCSACLLRTGLCLLTDERVAGVANIDRNGDKKKAARLGNGLGDLGDYELQEEIGCGGQGLVYRARQKSLNRTVALKVIGLGHWATEEHLKRFRVEAEAAARLEHPGIVPIHEVGERDGLCYFSMKFVEGGQLDEVARREPMSIRQLVELVAKVARTVHYAHEHGILHRDIKPGNILLDANGEPHLTDFGLARLVETESTVTRTREVLGTPSYMAPEQAAGETTKVSRATDVYGIGAVLYELLTNHLPFAGGTSYETIRLLLETEPRQPRLWNPKIDRDLSTICLKCLEKDPQRRYSSALALAEDLEHWLKHEPIGAKQSGFFTHTRKWIRRNPSTAVLVTLLVALAVSFGVSVWNQKPAVLIPKSIAVLPFENLSGDPDNAYFAEGVQEEVLTRLASIADLKVISHTSTQGYQGKPRHLRDIAKQLGVANIVEGSVQKTADQVRLNVQLINAQTDTHLWADTYDRKLTDVLGVESEIAKRIAESLQAKLTGHEEQVLAVKPTNNPEAYDAYLHGLALEERTFPTNEQDVLPKAIGFFERAVKLDPNFAPAWARLSRAHGFVYFIAEDTTATRRDAAKKALENAQKLEPSSPETLLALGYYQYRVLRDYGPAKTTFKQVRKMLPSSGEVPFALGAVARREGHWDEIVAYWEEALIFDPRNTQLLSETALTYQMLRQFPAALKLYDRVLDVHPNDPDAMALKVSIYQDQGDLQEAARFLSGINEQTPNQFTFEAKLTQLRLERNYAEAIRLLQPRLAQFHFGDEYEKGRNQVALAMTERLAGDTVGAKATAEQARKTLELVRKDQPDNFFAAQQLSLAYATLGEKESAIKEAERATMLLPSIKDRMHGPFLEENLAMIQMMFGENSRAISILSELLQVPYTGYCVGPVTPALLRVDPLWDPLRGDPAFQKLCEEKIDKSIAVLPFENLSSDPNSAYFAEGIQEEVLTRLAKIADLKVISRTSTSRYKTKPDNIAEIAKQLGVANIVEGSVQKAADQVRVNVQLINAQTDSHLWAETYDRRLTDILGVESEIAKGIAESLQAKLTSHEEHALTVKPTSNPEAYDLFLRGDYEFHQADSMGTSEDAFDRADAFYRQALARDPDFVQAAAKLARSRLQRHWVVSPLPAAELEEVKSLIDRALALAPNWPEAHFALGLFFYEGHRQYERALAEFNRVLELQPSNALARLYSAYVYRRRGEWERALADLQRAQELDPRDAEIASEIGNTYLQLRQWRDAERAELRALAIDPHYAFAGQVLVDSRLNATGDANSARRALDGFPEAINLVAYGGWGQEGIIQTWVYLYVIERRFADAFQKLDKQAVHTGRAHLYQLAGQAALRILAGQTEAAKSAGEEALPLLEARFRERPDDTGLMECLSWVYLAIGRNADALRLARQVADSIPIGKDAISGSVFQIELAEIEARAGAPEDAVKRLRHLLSIPAGPSIARLKVDPVWDPIRDRPDFQQLLSGPEQIGPNK